MSNIGKIKKESSYWTVPDYLYRKYFGGIIRNNTHKNMANEDHTFIDGRQYIDKLCVILSVIPPINNNEILFIVLIGDEKIIVPKNEIEIL